MESVTLENVIRRYVNLPPYPSSKGWYQVLCKVCNDHGRKGLRAGFRFEGEKTAYHCFNCGHAAVYDPNEMTSMPKVMERVLEVFGVPESEWQPVLFVGLTKEVDGGKGGDAGKQTNIEPQAITLPKLFYPLEDADPNDKWALIGKDYLEYNRGVNPGSYPFMLSRRTDNPFLDKWLGRLIIPVYKGNKLIFYQGRALGKRTQKYLSPSVAKEKVLYGYDRLFEYSDIPLYVVEGWFDAFVIDGVALLGNEISEPQATWLNKSRRRKVYIPDRGKSGRHAAIRALRLGWSISTPDIGSCEDVNAAVRRYGKMYVLKSIVDNTAEGFEAETNLEVYCSEPRKHKTKDKSTR